MILFDGRAWEELALGAGIVPAAVLAAVALSSPGARAAAESTTSRSC